MQKTAFRLSTMMRNKLFILWEEVGVHLKIIRVAENTGHDDIHLLMGLLGKMMTPVLVRMIEKLTY